MAYNVVNPIYTIAAIMLFGIVGFGPCIIFFMYNIWVTILYFCLWLGFLWEFIVKRCILRKILINSKGIEYQQWKDRKFISWEEMASIGISYGYFKKKMPINKWIYFSKENLDAYPIIDYKSINESFFTINYRKKIIKELKKYWDKDIS